MDATRSCRLVVCVAGLVALAGCGPNWEELHAIADKQLEAARLHNESVKEVVARPSGNAGENAWVAYETRMAAFQGELHKNRPTLFADVLNYLAQRDERMYRWFQLALNNPLTYAYVSGKFAGNSKGVTITAKDGSRIENIDLTQGSGSPFITGNDNAAASKDGQNQFGDGIQQQAGTDGPNQPNQETEGGDVNNESAFEPGVALP